LNDTSARLAKEAGLRIAISTDAHSIRELEHMRFGIDQARRGWLSPDDVLNTRSWPEMQKLLRQRKATLTNRQGTEEETVRR
jgi:DNA polymerase (family 10)